MPSGQCLLSNLIVYTIRSMEITYDPAKNARNLAERGLSFDRVADFDFGTSVVWQDDRRAYPEARFIAMGNLDGRLHVLCFAETDSGIRVISFRKANQREVKSYEEAFFDD